MECVAAGRCGGTPRFTGLEVGVAGRPGSRYGDSIDDTTPRRPYRTDLIDAQWALIEPLLTPWGEERTARGPDISPPRVGLREVFNALIYLDRTGRQWDLLPHDFPPWQTVYGYFAAWRDEGVFTQLNIEPVRLTRTDAGRTGSPWPSWTPRASRPRQAFPCPTRAPTETRS